MKRVRKYISILIILLVPLMNIKALSIEKNEITIDKGEKEELKLYANTNETIKSVSFSLVYSSYDIPANFIPDPKYQEELSGTKHIITFDENRTGKILLGTININASNNPKDTNGNININGASAIKNNGDTVPLNSQNITVTIEEKEQITENHKTSLLEKIESNLVKIDLKEGTYTYDITINNDIKELDLKAIPKENDTKVEISTQKINELKDNQIKITATQKDIKEEYTINVKINKEKAKVEIDNEEFIEDNSYKKKWTIIIGVLSVLLLISLIISKRK